MMSLYVFDAGGKLPSEPGRVGQSLSKWKISQDSLNCDSELVKCETETLGSRWVGHQVSVADNKTDGLTLYSFHWFYCVRVTCLDGPNLILVSPKSATNFAKFVRWYNFRSCHDLKEYVAGQLNVASELGMQIIEIGRQTIAVASSSDFSNSSYAWFLDSYRAWPKCDIEIDPLQYEDVL